MIRRIINQQCIIIVINIFVAFASYAQPTFDWANKLGGSSATINDECLSVITDVDGNVYSTGYFAGTADFNPGAGTFNLTATGSTDIYVQKVDSDGNFLWAYKQGGIGYNVGTSLVADAVGNLYVGGYFSGTADFNPDAGTQNFTSAGNYDIFIQKISPSGSLIWAKQLGSTGADFVTDITLNSSGNLCLIGSFFETVDFDPNAGVFTMNAGTTQDPFIEVLDVDGNFIWAKQIEDNAGGLGRSIITDNSGNIYACGMTQGIVDLDPGAGVFSYTSAGSYDMYIVKLNSSGNFIWAKTFGSVGPDYGNSLAIDANNNIYVAGQFLYTVDFDPSIATYNLTSGGSYDSYLEKLDSDGNFLWVKQILSASENGINAISLDVNGNIYSTGYFGGTADFDPSASTNNLTSFGVVNNDYDGFIQKVDPNGNFLWANQMGSDLDDIANSIHVDNSGKIFTAGYFRNTGDFDPSASVFNLTASGSGDAFVSVLSNCISVYGIDTQADCGPFTWIDGIVYNVSTNTPTFTLVGAAANGCDSIVTLNLTIEDLLDPVPTIASLPIVTSECSVTSLTAPTATDNCAGTITGTHNATLPITTQGTTTVTWTYNDGNGNTSTQTQDIVIDDITAPVADIATLSNITSECSVTSLTAPTATDNCAGTITGTHNVTLPIITQGTTTVTWTYDDGNGNTSTQTQDIVIDDVTAPLSNVAALSNITSECSVSSLTTPTATDNCVGSVTGNHNVTLPITVIGTTTVTWTYDDGNGNTSTQTQNVVITPIDNGITQVDAFTLSADASGYNYQWVDCNNGNQAINGETNQAFVATSNGNYAVEIDNGTCSVTSNCLVINQVGILEFGDTELVEVYPNPTSGVVTISGVELNTSIEIYNSKGELLQSRQSASSDTIITISGYSPGVYYVKLKGNSTEIIQKIVKY